MLTRGVGLHTVMAMSIDNSICSVIDHIAAEIIDYCKPIVTDKKRILEFIKEHNKAQKSEKTHIPDNYYDDIVDLIKND